MLVFIHKMTFGRWQTSIQVKLRIYEEIAFWEIFLGNTPISAAVRPHMRGLTAVGVFPHSPEMGGAQKLFFYMGMYLKLEP